jgi:hypothetical protein
MSKQNSNINDLLTPLITELLQKDELDNIKTEIIKEEIKTNKYQINHKNIAIKMLELTKTQEEETMA